MKLVVVKFVVLVWLVCIICEDLIIVLLIILFMKNVRLSLMIVKIIVKKGLVIIVNLIVVMLFLFFWNECNSVCFNSGFIFFGLCVVLFGYMGFYFY